MTCPNCKDTGEYMRRRGVGELPGPPVLVACDCPAGRRQRGVVDDYLRGDRGDPDLVPEWPWAPVGATWRNEQRAGRYLDYLLSPRAKPGALLFGASYAGKTTLARRWAELVASREGAEIAGVIWPDWIRAASTRHRDNPGRVAHTKALAAVPVLVLDDLFAGPVSPEEQEDILQGLLDRRRGRPHCTTICTTNLTAEQLAKRAERIMNRLHEMCDVLEVEGDWR